jgi:tyrosyl-tRNA synthetase
MATVEPAVHPVFLNQAETLCQGGELLPGGPQVLAKRLQQAVETDTPLRVKLGLDPTRPDLHLGHTVVLRKLRAFQDLGHQAVLIIGDATALIGDPSGRSATRPPLTQEEIAVNAATYLAQAGKVIDVPKAEIVHNSEWLAPLNMADLLRLTAKVTVAQMLVRDDFATRYQAQKPIYLHELLYPLMQAYDSVMVNADIELGGTDQRFNNLMGRELQTAYESGNPQMVLLMPLLEGTDGKIKMSKSYPEHCINLTDAPEDMLGKLMSIPDELIGRYQQLLTPATEAQIAQLEAAMFDTHTMNPRDAKMNLAKWLVALYNGQAAADAAEAAFVNRFKLNQLPEEMPEVLIAPDTAHPLVGLMVEHQLAPSRGEARRLIQGGGVRLDGDNKVTDVEATLTLAAGEARVLQVGKRKFIRFVTA